MGRQCSFRELLATLSFLLPGVVCLDKADFTVRHCLAWLPGCRREWVTELGSGSQGKGKGLEFYHRTLVAA